MIKAWLRTDGTVPLLTKILNASILLTCVGAGWALTSLFLSGRASGEAMNSIDAMRTRMQELRGQIAEAEALQTSTRPGGSAAVSAFQWGMAQVAAKHGCTVTEFQSSGSTSPYLSKFTKETPNTTWGQVDIKSQLQGRAADVIATLAELKSLDIPFEFSVIEISRQDVTKEGASVTALVEFSILIQPEGGQ
jgi:hypothetical protein